MASLSKDAAGNRTIQFVGTDKKRRSLRLGKVNAKQAESLKIKVEALASAQAAKIPLDAETAKWLGEIGDDMAAKLAAVGLVPERQSRKLGEFLDEYLEQRKPESKPSTVANIHRVILDLVKFFGPRKALREVGVADAQAFKTAYLTRDKKLAAATLHRRLKMARMLFGHAMKLKLLPANPFADVKSKNANPAENRHFITAVDTGKLIAAANPTWRTIVALARFGGLRCPSEVLSLKWAHVNFVTGRMTVSSPKTEHHEGRAYRVVPIFPELRPFLEEAYELAEDHEEFVVGGPQGDGYRRAAQRKTGWNSANVRTTFSKLVRKAGLVQWPRLFQNLRSSRETELMAKHAIHVVTAWMGNTPNVALGHYLQTLDSDFEKAINEPTTGGAKSGAVVVQNAVQTGANRTGREKTDATDYLQNEAFRRVLFDSVELGLNAEVPRVGLEPTTR